MYFNEVVIENRLKIGNSSMPNRRLTGKSRLNDVEARCIASAAAATASSEGTSH